MSYSIPLLRALLLIPGLIVLSSCALTRPLTYEEHEKLEQAKGGEHRKTWSGRSYAAQTRIDPVPSPSAAAIGFDAERVWSGFDDWEPAMAVDRSSNYVYQMTTRYGEPECPGCSPAVIAFRRSSDGGTTWEPDQRIHSSRLGQFDPLIEVSDDGTLFAAFMLSYTPGVMFIKSTDHGTTWSAPMAIGNRLRNPWSDKPVLAVSGDGRHVYIAFNTSDSFVAASHDGGLTFEQPVKTNKDGRYWYHFQGAVAPDGTVYFAAEDVSQDFTGPQYVDVLRSTNLGRSFTVTRLDTSAESPLCPWAAGCYQGFFAATPGLAVDSAGAVMFTYTQSSVDQGPMQLYVRRSPDGINWYDRELISQPAPGITNAFPVLAAGLEPGDFRIAWQDDRNGANVAWNTWYRSTTDGGLTWSAEAKLSDQASGAPYKSASGHLFPYGDYFEMGVDASGRTHIVWGEGTSWDGPGGTWYTRGR